MRFAAILLAALVGCSAPPTTDIQHNDPVCQIEPDCYFDPCTDSQCNVDAGACVDTPRQDGITCLGVGADGGAFGGSCVSGICSR